MRSPLVDAAVALQQQGRLAEAEATLRRALASSPDEGEAMHVLALVLQQLGRHDEAEPFFARALDFATAETEPVFHQNFASFCLLRQRWADAETLLRRVLALQPDHFVAMNNLGLALHGQGRGDEAIAAWRATLAVRPDYAHAVTNLTNALGNRGIDAYRRGDLSAAVACWRDAHAVAPDHVAVLVSLAGGLLDEGLVAEATLLYRRATEIDPADAVARSGLLLALHYDPRLTPAQIAAEHFRFGEIHEACVSRLPPPPRPHDLDPERVIRLGYVSPNFRRHAVATFVQGLLRSHDRSRVHVTCYSDVPGGNEDDLTAVLRGHCDSWLDTASLSDEQLAERVAADRQEILVDLTGHLGGNRLLAFARKLAPVQVTFIGYQSTTGLAAMDCRITDAVADPPGETEALHTEQLVRVPCLFAYEPPADAPDVAPPPAMRSGAITFGSLNHPAKHSDDVLAVWARLLGRVANSRLMLLVASASGEGRAALADRCVRAGIAADRVLLVPRVPPAEYLRLYHKIDVALDPWPFSGHTTTCDALWMGVPVVTLAGRTYASRMSASVLAHLPMPELIATTPEGYVDLAASLAQDGPRLATIRAGLRDRVRVSTVTNAAGFTQTLEDAYRAMWRRYCASAGANAGRTA